MVKRAEKYTSHDIQNEILDIMALTVTREIGSVIRRASYYTIMADEITDASNREQVAVCFRWVDDDFECHEDFVAGCLQSGLYGSTTRTCSGRAHHKCSKRNKCISA